MCRWWNERHEKKLSTCRTEEKETIKEKKKKVKIEIYYNLYKEGNLGEFCSIVIYLIMVKISPNIRMEGKKDAIMERKKEDMKWEKRMIN